MVIECDTLILGATFYGCGLASRLLDCRIIEPSVVPGWDFALTFNPGQHWFAPLSTQPAIEFRHELLQRNALSTDGVVAVEAFSPLLSRWCLKNNIKIEFKADIIKNEHGRIDVFGVEGRRSYFPRQVISAMPVLTGRKKYITALISSPKVLRAGTYGEFELKASIHGGDYYLALPVLPECDWTTARALLHQVWRERPLDLKACQLILIAPRFDYRNFDNPGLALEYGASGNIKL